MRPKRVAILGATGSIGESAQNVARQLPDRMRIVAMAARNNVKKLTEAAREFLPSSVCAGDEAGATEIRRALASETEVLYGEDGLVKLATRDDVDMVLVAIVGTGGLRPALAAIEAGKDLAIASKEILVMAGPLIMREAKRRGVRILPVDSEHNAIFQCLEGQSPEAVRRLVLTCSGGPFRHLPSQDLASVTPEMALRHPTWQMGPKITVDSATLFNKGLEVIEARWLFDTPISKIDVIIHPQSIIHSMVEFIDGSVLAQLSQSDMCFPIQYAITYPDRVPNSLQPLDFARLSRLEFEPPRRDAFPALDLAYSACAQGGTAPAVLNAANEVAVARFLEREIAFSDIWKTVDHVLRSCPFVANPALEEILLADQTAREIANAFEV